MQENNNTINTATTATGDRPHANVENQNQIQITEFSIDALIKANPWFYYAILQQGQICNMKLSDGSLAEITLPCSIFIINERHYYLIEPLETGGIQKEGSGGTVVFAREVGLNDKIPISGYSDDNEYCLAIKKTKEMNNREGRITAKAREKTEVIEDYSSFVMDRIRGVLTDFFISNYEGYDKDSLVLHIAMLYLNELSRLYSKGIVHCDCSLHNSIFDSTKGILTIFDFDKSFFDEEKISNSDKIDPNDYIHVKRSLDYLAKFLTKEKQQKKLKEIAEALAPDTTDNNVKLTIHQAVDALKEMKMQLQSTPQPQTNVVMVQTQTDTQLCNKFGLFQSQNPHTEERVVTNGSRNQNVII